MSSSPFTPGVVVIGAIAVLICGLSLWFSRVYLPAKIKSAYRKAITALAAAVETKDSGTIGHAKRVAAIAVEVARRLGVTGRELERVEFAALLRDIGKANVPQGLLAKSEALTPEEWKVLQSHSLLGAEMVAAVPFLADTAELVRHHHEYWDGTGYPDGLRGEQIPLGSRILAVASDYDAMISDRPYHASLLSHEEAIAEIKRLSGVRYDPAVVDVFLQVVEQWDGAEEVSAAA